MSDDDFGVCLKARLYPTGFPVPEYDIPTRVPTADPFAIRRKSNLAGITSYGMTGESLLSVLSKVVGAIDEDLVVKGLRGKEFFYSMSGFQSKFLYEENCMRRTGGMQSYGRHRVHERLGDVLDDNWDVVVPSTYSFVIGGCDKTSIFVNKGDSVDWTEMLIVFLSDFSRIHVILHIQVNK